MYTPQKIHIFLTDISYEIQIHLKKYKNNKNILNVYKKEHYK